MRYTIKIYVCFGLVVTTTEMLQEHQILSSNALIDDKKNERTTNINLPYNHSSIESDTYSLYMNINKPPRFNKKKYYEKKMNIALPEETKLITSIDPQLEKTIVALNIDLSENKFANKRVIMEIFDEYNINKIRFFTIRCDGLICSPKDLQVLQRMIQKYNIEYISIQRHNGAEYEEYHKILEPYLHVVPQAKNISLSIPLEELSNNCEKHVSIKFHEVETQKIEKKNQNLSFMEKCKMWFYHQYNMPIFYKEYHLVINEMSSREQRYNTNKNTLSIFLPEHVHQRYDHVISSEFHEIKTEYFQHTPIHELILHNVILSDILYYDFLKNIEKIVIYTTYNKTIKYDAVIAEIQNKYSCTNFEINISNTNNNFIEKMTHYRQNAKFNHHDNTTSIILPTRNISSHN